MDGTRGETNVQGDLLASTISCGSIPAALQKCISRDSLFLSRLVGKRSQSVCQAGESGARCRPGDTVVTISMGSAQQRADLFQRGLQIRVTAVPFPRGGWRAAADYSGVFAPAAARWRAPGAHGGGQILAPALGANRRRRPRGEHAGETWRDAYDGS